MKKLIVSAFALAMMTTGAMAGEQLTKSQLDQVTAGFFGGVQINKNATRQVAVAIAKAGNKCGAFNICATSGATAVASNSNVTGQANVD